MFDRKFKSVPTSPQNKPRSRAALMSERNEKSFSYLLKILLPNFGNAPKGLKFLIADTLVFSSGDPRFLVYNSRVNIIWDKNLFNKRIGQVYQVYKTEGKVVFS